MAEKLTVNKLFTPMPDNPRTMDDESASGLRESLQRFGDISGIVWNKRTGHLVCGHQRLERLSELYGRKNLKLSKKDNDHYWLETPDGKRFTVRVVDWDETTERQANLSANNPYIMGVFDVVKLDNILNELIESDAKALEALRLDRLHVHEDLLKNKVEITLDDDDEPDDEDDDVEEFIATIIVEVEVPELHQAKEVIETALNEAGIKCTVKIQ